VVGRDSESKAAGGPGISQSIGCPTFRVPLLDANVGVTTATGIAGINNNQIDGAAYDAAGNMLCTVATTVALCNTQGGHTLTYDAENRIIAVDSGTTATYEYDAEGHRAGATINGVSYQYVYDPANHLSAAFQNSGGSLTWLRGEIYAGSPELFRRLGVPRGDYAF